MSVRDELEELIKPRIPTDWKLLPYQDNIDQPDTPTVMFKQLKIENTKEAPRGSWTFTFVLTLVDGRTDPEIAEPALDDEVETLWMILNSISSVNPTLAEKVLFQNAYLAYDITTEVLGQKES